MDDLFSNALGQLLADQCLPDVVRSIEAGGSAVALWRHIEDAGFCDALVAEAQGGAGLALPDVFATWTLCGSHALPVPLAETMLARALLAEAGVDRPQGPIALAEGSTQPGGGVRCDTVRSGRVATWVLAWVGDSQLLLETAKAESSPAGFCLDASLTWPASSIVGAPRMNAPRELLPLQACVYAAQLAGALTRVLESTLQYANERQQFGRPIGKFQAIQHQLAALSEHAFAARMAAQLGCQSPTAWPEPARAAVAKARASEAATEVAALSHSIHGAIGFTAEFDLQLYTRRLQLWRQAGGSESYWHGVLGQLLVEPQAGLTLDHLRRITDIQFSGATA